MFALVHLEDRFVGPFVALLFLGVFSSVKLKQSVDSHRLLSGVTFVFLVMFALHIGPVTTLRNLRSMLSGITNKNSSQDPNCQVVEDLRRLGIGPGSKVASLEYSNQAHVAWARLAKVRIVAEICPKMSIKPSAELLVDGVPFRSTNGSKLPGEDLFWIQRPEVQTQVIEDFRKAGADAIVARRAPAEGQSLGWYPVGDRFAYLLGGRGALNGQVESEASRGDSSSTRLSCHAVPPRLAGLD